MAFLPSGIQVDPPANRRVGRPRRHMTGAQTQKLYSHLYGAKLASYLASCIVFVRENKFESILYALTLILCFVIGFLLPLAAAPAAVTNAALGTSWLGSLWSTLASIARPSAAALPSTTTAMRQTAVPLDSLTYLHFPNLYKSLGFDTTPEKSFHTWSQVPSQWEIETRCEQLFETWHPDRSQLFDGSSGSSGSSGNTRSSSDSTTTVTTTSPRTHTSLHKTPYTIYRVACSVLTDPLDRLHHDSGELPWWELDWTPVGWERGGEWRGSHGYRRLGRGGSKWHGGWEEGSEAGLGEGGEVYFF